MFELCYGVVVLCDRIKIRGGDLCLTCTSIYYWLQNNCLTWTLSMTLTVQWIGQMLIHGVSHLTINVMCIKQNKKSSKHVVRDWLLCPHNGWRWQILQQYIRKVLDDLPYLQCMLLAWNYNTGLIIYLRIFFNQINVFCSRSFEASYTNTVE